MSSVDGLREGTQGKGEIEEELSFGFFIPMVCGRSADRGVELPGERARCVVRCE